MLLRRLLIVLGAVTVIAGCAKEPALSQLSGKVTFKGEPVPAGWISFTPDVDTGGEVRVMQIVDGAYDSAREPQKGLPPGKYSIRIAGFDGVRIPMYGQGKQIFNPIDDELIVPAESTTKDFVIPDSAGENVKIQPTADT